MSFTSQYLRLCFVAILAISLPAAALAAEQGEQRKAGMLKRLLEKKKETENNPEGSKKGLYVKGKGKSEDIALGDRSFVVYTPQNLPRHGDIPLLIVLHGGFGSADQIHKYIGLDPYADERGFIIAYLDGTQVARGLPAKMRGWNAGGCCGQPQARGVDDLSFISGVIDYMTANYGVNRNNVYGTGHSNGAMMSQRVICETDLYKDAVTISGTLQMDLKTCPNASGNHVINIHGSDDANLPIEGGFTVEGFNKKTNYKSQSYAQDVFERSGAKYDLIYLQGADHSPETINAVLWKTEHMSLPNKIVNLLGL